MMERVQGGTRMRRYELADEAWELVRKHMPATDRPGGRWNDHRSTLDGVFWVLNSGPRNRPVA